MANQVNVQLTAAGAALADGGTLTISALGKTFAFAAGAAQPVSADDWTWLKTRPNPVDGQKLFELVPAAAPVPAQKVPGLVAVLKPAAPAPAAEAAPTDSTKETPGK